MTDFRVVVPEHPDEALTRELEWESQGPWAASEKEYGEVEWTQGLPLSLGDREALVAFFRLPDSLSLEDIRMLSPGQLTDLHSVSIDEASVVVQRCGLCGEHDLIGRLESSGWKIYGRRCDFSWYRGSPVSGPEEVTRRAMGQAGP